MVSSEVISQLRGCLSNTINESIQHHQTALLLSGGADSTLVGLAAHHLGKSVTAISFQIEGIKNIDCEVAERTAQTMGWQFHRVVIPEADYSDWFLRLMLDYRCKKKTELEILYPFIHLVERLKDLGIKQVLTGFGAPFPQNRNDNIEARNDIDSFWKRMIEQGGIVSSATTKCIEYASSEGITMITPLNDMRFLEALKAVRFEELNKPYSKAVWKKIFEEDFSALSLLQTGVLNLQKGAGIEDLFASVLDDPQINYRRYVKGSIKDRMRSVVRLWSGKGDGTLKDFFEGTA